MPITVRASWRHCEDSKSAGTRRHVGGWPVCDVSNYRVPFTFKGQAVQKDNSWLLDPEDDSNTNFETSRTSHLSKHCLMQRTPDQTLPDPANTWPDIAWSSGHESPTYGFHNMRDISCRADKIFPLSRWTLLGWIGWLVSHFVCWQSVWTTATKSRNNSPLSSKQLHYTAVSQHITETANRMLRRRMHFRCFGPAGQGHIIRWSFKPVCFQSISAISVTKCTIFFH